MKYKFKKINKMPQHIQNGCYVITVEGHTMFPEDVIKKLNDLETLLKQRSELRTTAVHATALPKSCRTCKEYSWCEGYSSECYENGHSKWKPA